MSGRALGWGGEFLASPSSGPAPLISVPPRFPWLQRISACEVNPIAVRITALLPQLALSPGNLPWARPASPFVPGLVGSLVKLRPCSPGLAASLAFLATSPYRLLALTQFTPAMFPPESSPHPQPLPYHQHRPITKPSGQRLLPGTFFWLLGSSEGTQTLAS